MESRKYLNTGNAGAEYSSVFVTERIHGTALVTDEPEVVEFQVWGRDAGHFPTVRLDVDQVDDLIAFLTKLRKKVKRPAKKVIPQVTFHL